MRVLLLIKNKRNYSKSKKQQQTVDLITGINHRRYKQVEVNMKQH